MIKKIFFTKQLTILLPIWMFFIPNISFATINLNDFFSDPSVSIAQDGSSAIMAEDLTLSPVSLYNDPFLGSTEIIIATENSFLIFDYNFIMPVGNNDQFGAFIIDPDSGASLGVGFEFFTTTPNSGTLMFDLNSLVDTTNLGLQFELFALPGDLGLDSTVTISNVHIQVIPLPGAFPLFLIGMSILLKSAYLKRRMFFVS